MKSIKQQYIDLQEGRMSQANFMRNLRMTLPHLVTNVTSFNDSIKILKNKGILNEVVSPSELAMGIKVEMEHTDNPAIAKKIAMDHLAENPNYYSELKTSGIDTAQGLKSTIGSGDSNLNKANPRDGFSLGFFEESENSLNEAKDEKTKWTNTSGKSMYDQFKEIDNLNGQEVLISIDAEMERNHELTKAEAAKIVIKNLKKNPIYYTAEYMSGKEGYEPEYLGGKSANAEARQMQPLDKNMGNVVDKKMGMQPVKNVEKAKKDSDKATAQKYKTSGISLMSLVAKTTRGVKKMDPTGEKMKTIKEGQYDFIGRFKRGEESLLRKTISDAKIEVEEEDQKVTTYVTSEKHSDKEIEKAVKSITNLNEIRFNDFGDPNKATSLAMSFIESNPTLKSISDKLTVQNSHDDAILKYEYWGELPGAALTKLKMQFDVERMEDFDEDTGTIIAYRLTPKSNTPTGDVFDRNTNITAGLKALTKEDLMQIIREELKERFDGMEPVPMSLKKLDEK